ncbi:MAG: hypothetical protein NWF07_08040 [Candidatus Bathyarchaeota archaeon]|nr:hypothetical protein [Candidatus Bathyarchaeota archaeon]
MTAEDERLADTLVEEYRLMFIMYEGAIKQIPETHWKSGDIDYLIPARLVFHAIEAADYYTTDTPPGNVWKNRYGIDPESGHIPAEKLPNQQQMLEYHQEVCGKIYAWLGGLTMTDMLVSEEKFPWTGPTLLGRIMYLLGHYRQHFGELNAELRRRDIPRIKWTVVKK